MNDRLIKNTVAFVKSKLQEAEGGHDWFHTERVWKLARRIASEEVQADQLIVDLGALLHDIADAKFHEGDESLAPGVAAEFLESEGVEPEVIQKVIFIIKNISFKNQGQFKGALPLELQIVQDADRLDALGAVGIARTFNFGGFKNNRLYDPDIPPQSFDREKYRKYNGTTINHFYEKLLLLKEQMNTSAGKRLAQDRHQYMEEFLHRFLKEWEGEF